MLGSDDRLPGIWLMNHKPVFKLQKQEGAAETPQHANDATVKASRATIHSDGLERVLEKRYHGIKGLAPFHIIYQYEKLTSFYPCKSSESETLSLILERLQRIEGKYSSKPSSPIAGSSSQRQKSTCSATDDVSETPYSTPSPSGDPSPIPSVEDSIGLLHLRTKPSEGISPGSPPLDVAYTLSDTFDRVRDLRLKRTVGLQAITTEGVLIPPELARTWIHNYFTYTPTETFLSLVDRKMIEMIPDMLTMKHVTLDPCILIVYYVILWRGCYILNTRSFHSPDRKYARQLYLCCLRAIPTWQQEATGSITDFIAAIFMTGVATEMFDFDSSLEMHQLACDYAKGLHLHSLDGYDYFAVTEPGSTRTDGDRRGMWELIQTDLFYHLIYNKPAKLFRSLDSWQVNLPWLSLDSTPNNDAPVPTIAFLVRSRLTFVLIHFFQMIKTLDNESEAVNSIEPLCHEIESLLEEWRIEDWVQRSAHENDMINLWILGDLLLNGYTCIIFMLRKATLLKTNSPNPISSDDNIPKTHLSTRISRRILELTYLMLHVWRFPAAEAISYILGAYRAHIAYAHIASNMINAPGLEENATADLDLLDRVAQSIETAAQEECDFAPLVRVMKKINAEVRERVTGVDGD
ncbi:hypothetical protein CGCA056_v010911 [Colletotrichum aenigma]|uniref:uncharacterized protein n=1 Tax=Colletotrichum aenigma TaxID=1215731 RepID=UPI00187336C9|nr:uncharacterized protein CGCA056_v010911 [Colletotrichum aenigma]KAF5517282.1 hypothetical protein CGCA056_v010911 [Colletotrichum aenigma]